MSLLAWGVRVRVDRTPPQFQLPGDMTVPATSPSGATVTYTATATDNIDPAPGVSCTPASGSTLPLGSTVIQCVATDQAGNEKPGSFTVTVQEAGVHQQLADMRTYLAVVSMRASLRSALDLQLEVVMRLVQRDRIPAARLHLRLFEAEVRALARVRLGCR